MGAGLTKSKIFFLNIDKLSELQIAGSSLFHSEIGSVFQIINFQTENGDAAYISWSIRWVSDRIYIEKVLKMLIFKNFIQKTKSSVPTSKSKGF